MTGLHNNGLPSWLRIFHTKPRFGISFVFPSKIGLVKLKENQLDFRNYIIFIYCILQKGSYMKIIQNALHVMSRMKRIRKEITKWHIKKLDAVNLLALSGANPIYFLNFKDLIDLFRFLNFYKNSFVSTKGTCFSINGIFHKKCTVKFGVMKENK